jgi:hypothetical protein
MGMVTINFEIGQEPYVLKDALIFTQEEYEELTPEDIIAMQQKRYAAWYEIVNTPPEPSLLEPVLPIEDQ